MAPTEPSKPEEPKMVVASIDQALDRAIETHLKGDVDYAKYVCQRILQVDPNNAAARHHLRLIEHWRDVAAMVRGIAGPRITAAEPVIFDVGANTGKTVEVYRTLFPAAAIHAFEPDPELSGPLAEKLRDDPRTIVNPVAVGAAEATLPFNVCRAGGNDGIGSFLPLNPDNETVRHLKAETVRTIEVPVTTLDAYCAERGIGRIDFLKLDVQGFEDQCLLGAGGLLAQGAIRMVQVELLLSDMYARTLSFYDIEAILRPHGYRLHAIDDVYPRLGTELFQLDAFYVAP